MTTIFCRLAFRQQIQVRAYSDDGELRPFSAVLAIPRAPSTVAVRNKGQVEFPITASVDQFYVERPSSDHQNFIQNIEGGALRTYPMSPDVEAVEVVIETDGRPLNARIEILQGPNTDKQARPANHVEEMVPHTMALLLGPLAHCFCSC